MISRSETLASLADHYEFKPANAGRRTILPTLVILCGGVGAGIGRRIKWNLDRNGVQAHVRYLLMDTDETSQSSEGEFPGYQEREFVHLSIERVHDVLSDPTSHKLLAERLNLADDPTRTGLLSIIERGLDQAGQVRPIGVIAFWANYGLFKRKLERQLAELRGIYSQLSQQLELSDDVRLRPRLQVVVIGSLAGGTNSSFCTDLVACLRQEMASHNIQVNGYYVLPNALDGKLAGKTVEQIRVRANAYHTLRAIEAFDGGFGREQEVYFGGTEHEKFASPSTLHNNVFLIERYTADDRDLVTLESVQDVVALHVAADIGTEIGDQLETADHNDVTRQNLAPDPATGRPRRFSTLGASALGIPYKKLFRYSFARQHMDVYDMVIGDRGRSKGAMVAAADFLREIQLNEGGETLLRAYRTAVAPDIDVFVKPLYRRSTPNGRQYHRNGEFPSLLHSARQHFRDKHLPKIVKHLQELLDETAKDRERKMKQRVGEIIQSQGLAPAQDFLMHLRAELERTDDRLTESSRKSQTQAVEADKRACAEVENLKGLVKKFLITRAVQDRGANWHRQSLLAAIEAEAAKIVSTLTKRLQTQCARSIERLTQSLTALDQLRMEAERLKLRNTPSRQGMTTASSCEVDVSTPEMFANFYAENACKPHGLIKSVATARQLTEVAARQELSQQGASLDELHRQIELHFSERVNNMTIAQLLERDLAQAGPARDAAMLKLREAVRATQPMWRAEPGRLGVTFGDTITIGIPGGATNETRAKLFEALKEASAALNTNPRYMADASSVSISDPHRIIVLRRSHGGRPHYLKCWNEIKRAAEAWDRDGGHPVVTFSKELLALMPPIEPLAAVSQTDEAFALALGLGFVARRGSYYFWNLVSEGGNDPVTRVARLASEWDGLAFVNSELNLADSTRLLVNTGRLSYQSQNDGDPQLLLADSLEKARRAFAGDRKKEAAVLHAFNDLRAVAGNQNVRRDLTQYVKSLSRRVKPIDAVFGLVTSQVDALNQIIARLNNGV